jgi:hypothetical protein
MDTSPQKSPPMPFLFGAALLSAGSIVPSIWIYTSFLMGPCGDGLCGFWESILAWLSLSTMTLILIGVGALRGERAWWLAALAFVTLGAPLAFVGLMGLV